MKKNKVTGWLKSIGFGLLMIVIFYIIQIAVSAPFPDQFDTVATIATGIIMSVWYYLKYVRKSQQTTSETLKRSFGGNRIILYILVALICFTLSSIIQQLLNLAVPELVRKINDIITNDMSGDPWGSFFAIVLFAPLGEECLVRGFILKQSQKHLTPIFAIILSSVLFGVLHMNIIQGIYVLPLALVCGYIAYATDSILPTILIHAIHNGINYPFSLLPSFLQTNIIFYLACLIVFTVIFIMLFKKAGLRISFTEKQEVIE